MHDTDVVQYVLLGHESPDAEVAAQQIRAWSGVFDAVDPLHVKRHVVVAPESFRCRAEVAFVPASACVVFDPLVAVPVALIFEFHHAVRAAESFQL